MEVDVRNSVLSAENETDGSSDTDANSDGGDNSPNTGFNVPFIVIGGQLTESSHTYPRT